MPRLLESRLLSYGRDILSRIWRRVLVWIRWLRFVKFKLRAKIVFWFNARLRWLRLQDFEWWARLITVGYLSIFLGVIVARFGELISLPLNELGDFAAGVFGPLAFLWLVLGYRQQGKELNASTVALEQQVSELHATFALQQENAEKQDRMLDPVLDISWVEVVSDDNGPYEKLRIANSGDVCKRIRINFSPADGSDNTCGGTLLSQLATDRTATFSGPRIQVVSSWRIIVNYIRANGSKGAQVFVMFRIPGRDPFITHEPEPPV